MKTIEFTCKNSQLILLVALANMVLASYIDNQILFYSVVGINFLLWFWYMVAITVLVAKKHLLLAKVLPMILLPGTCCWLVMLALTAARHPIWDIVYLGFFPTIVWVVVIEIFCRKYHIGFHQPNEEIGKYDLGNIHTPE